MINLTRDSLKHAAPANSEPTDAPMTRRSFVVATAAASVVTASGALARTELLTVPIPFPADKIGSKRILVGSGTPDGILSYGWDASSGTLTPEGIAAKISHSTWLDLSLDRRFLYVACELDEFERKPTGAVGSFRNESGKLTQISLVPSEGKGTCHLNIDRTGRAVICANYSGGTAASFLSTSGKLTPVWHEVYKGSGPVTDRQGMAHAHFASFSPDNRFVYINDLGADRIHIYKLDAATAELTPAGTYNAAAGDGPRTLHFHSSGKVAYCVNELNSTIEVLEWNAADGSLHSIQKVSLSPKTTKPDGTRYSNTACDAVLTRDGRFAYFANRGDDFLLGFHTDPATGRLTEFATNARTSCGGTTPRNFRLDPAEHWMLVANQSSSNLSVFARDPKTGILSNEGKNTPAATPMCIVFV
jgi:6-phosphogluconolactonase